MITTEKIYMQPATIEEALEATNAHGPDFTYVAGGTDIFVNKFQGNEVSGCLIDISTINGLDEIHVRDGYLSIGPLVTLKNIGKNEIIKREFPILAEAAEAVGSPLIRATATIGGNLLCENRCIFYNQSDWWREAIGYCLKCEGDICIATGSKKKCYSELVSDTVPALISMDAEVKFEDEGGSKTVNLENIYSGDGVNPRNLNKNALITEVRLPLGRGYKTVFKKLRLRRSLDFTSLTSAVSLNKDGRLRIVLAGVDPGPVIIEGSFVKSPDDFIKEALRKAKSIDNEMMSRNYRREMIKVFITNSLNEIKNKLRNK